MVSTAVPFARLLSPSLTLAAGLLLALSSGCAADAPCAAACPTGSQCIGSAQQGGAPFLAGGVCVADGADPLRLDLPLHRVSSALVSDLPALRCPLAAQVAANLDLTFRDRDQGLGVKGRVACRDDGGLGFSADLPPGRYDLQAGVLETAWTALKGLEVRGDRQDLRVDLGLGAVAGPLFLNGLPALLVKTCDENRLQLDFFGDQGATAFYQNLCPADPAARYALNLPVGTYRVAGTLNGQPVAADGFTVAGPSASLPLNLASFQVRGTVSLNGVRLRGLAVCASAKDPSLLKPLTLVFTSQGADKTAYQQTLTCGELEGGFSATLPIGTYEVAAVLEPGFLPASLPPRVRAAAPLSVRGDRDDVIVDLRAQAVGGRLALGRARASLCGATAAGPGSVTLRFFDAAGSAALDSDPRRYQQLSVPCGESDAVDFQTSLTPGVYTVGLGPTARPLWTPRTDPVLLPQALTVEDDRAGALALPALARVEGRLLIENTLPTAPTCKGDEQVMVALAFRERQSGAVTVVPVRCQDRDSFRFQADLLPGAYDVSVGAGEAPPPDLAWPARTPYDPLLQGMVPVVLGAAPGGPLVDGLVVSGDRAELRLVLRARVVRGTLTLNGRPPAVAADCARAAGDDLAMVNLVFLGQPGVRLSVPIPCKAADYAFTAPLTAGLYQVALRPYGDRPFGFQAPIAPPELPVIVSASPPDEPLLPLVQQLRLR